MNLLHLLLTLFDLMFYLLYPILTEKDKVILIGKLDAFFDKCLVTCAKKWFLVFIGRLCGQPRAQNIDTL